MIHADMRRFIIRTDAGGEIGFGHAMRSISLAKHLRDFYGIEAIFYSNPYDKLENLYQSYGFQYVLNDGLSEAQLLCKIKDEYPGAVLFIDKLYPYDRETIHGLRNGLKIIMLHNECEGMYEGDFAIFPSAHLNDKTLEDERWSYSPAEFLYGPKYVIINDHVVKSVAQHKNSNPQPYIAISTGATDPEGIFIRILEWINESKVTAKIKALYGFDFYHKASLLSLIPRLKPTIEVKEFNYEDLLSSHLAVSAVGVTTYELIFANIPLITIGHIQKNALAGEILQKRYGCNHHLGMFKNVTSDQFISAIQHLWNSEEALRDIKEKQANLIDGKGINRLAEIIYDCCSNKQ